VAGPAGLWLARPASAPAPAQAQASEDPATGAAGPAIDIPPALAQQAAGLEPAPVQAVAPGPDAMAPALAASSPPPATDGAARMPAQVLSPAPAQPAASSPEPAAQAPAPAPTLVATATPAPAPAMVQVQVEPAQTRLSVRPRDGEAVSSEEAEANAVRAAMAALYAAVGDRDEAAAANAMAELDSLLPARSLTLLRARAWQAHGSGDLARAEQLYRQILERVPEDEHAGVNLALLEARMGDPEQARNRLERLAARNTRSAQVARARAELEAMLP